MIDLESREPVAGAEIVEWYVGGGPSDGQRPVHSARWATSRTDGVFVIDAARANLRTRLGQSYGPRLVFVHPEYGLQRQARRAAADSRFAAGDDWDGDLWVLEGDKRRVAQARRDLQPYCRGGREDGDRHDYDDPGSRRIREVACPRSPARPTEQPSEAPSPPPDSSG